MHLLLILNYIIRLSLEWKNEIFIIFIKLSMKIINAHCHLIEIEKAFDNNNVNIEFLSSISIFKDAKALIPFISEKEIIHQMDEAGIEKTVLFACICPILYSSNEFVADVCSKHPDRFIGFASVDPKLKNAIETLENAIKNLKLKGLKLHPPLQNFYPNDKKLWPVYELANYFNIPVVFHVGTTPFGKLTLLKQANPILIDDVAVEFPDLKIILTHLGTLWHNESFMVTEKNPNVYIDTAAYPYEITEILNEKLIKRVGENKFIFGTDFPMPYEGSFHKMQDFVKAINGLEISENMKEKIFSKNFEKIVFI